jgi:hypothetical protein
MATSIPSASICKFQQTSAPTGWTKITSYNDYAIRITSSTASTGGTRNFTTVFANQAPTAGGTMGAVSGVVVNPANAGAVSHAHPGFTLAPAPTIAYDPLSPSPSWPAAIGVGGAFPPTTTSAGGGVAHNHTISVPGPFSSPSALTAGPGADFSINYVDMIIAQRN